MMLKEEENGGCFVFIVCVPLCLMLLLTSLKSLTDLANYLFSNPKLVLLLYAVSMCIAMLGFLVVFMKRK